MILTDALSARMGSNAVTSVASTDNTAHNFYVFPAQTLTLSKLLSGSVGLFKNGQGALTLNANNTYTGTTTISGGTLKNGTTTAFSSGSMLNVNAGIFDLNGFNARAASVTAGNAAGTITNSGAGSGTNTLTITNFGSVNLALLITDGATAKTAVTLSNNNAIPTFANANNTFSGGITIAYTLGGGPRIYQYYIPVTNTLVDGILTKSNFGTGTIYIGSSASAANAQLALGTTNTTIYNNIVFNAAGYVDGGLAAMRLDATGIKFYGALISNLSDINLSSQVTSSSTAYGQLSGIKGLLLKTPAGAGSTFTLTLANTATNNNYSGNTTISTRTTIALSAVNQIPNGTGKGNLIINGGTFAMNGFSETINALSGTGTVNGVNGTPTLTVGDNNATSTFSGTIINTAGSLSITKIGTGTLTLGGNNTYTGTTNITQGSLQSIKTTSLSSVATATFTPTTLAVSFSVPPVSGDNFRFFPSSTTQTYGSVSLTNSAGLTGSYNSSNSVLSIGTTPSTISGLQLWLDANDPTVFYDSVSGGSVVTTDGTAIARWEDKSGNLRHATQATAANRPLLKTTSQNNKNTLLFDGVSDFLTTNVTGFKSYTAATIIAVMRPLSATAADNNNFLGWWWGSDAVGALGLFASTGILANEKIAMVVGNSKRLGSSTYSRPADTAQFFTTTFSTTGTRLYANLSPVTLDLATAGVTTSTNTSPAAIGFTTNDTIYLNYTSLAGPQNRFCEFLIYNRVLSTSELSDVWNYLSTKWSIY